MLRRQPFRRKWGWGAPPFGVLASRLEDEDIWFREEAFSTFKSDGKGQDEAASDAAAPRRIVGGGCLRFLLSPPPLPAKMSDMEDDFMCDDEEDYDLVRRRERSCGGRRVLSVFRGPGQGRRRPLRLERVCFPASPGAVTGGFASSPSRTGPGPLLLWPGRGLGPAEGGGPGPCDPVPSASGLYLVDIPGLRRPVLGASSLLPPREPPRGRCSQRSRPRRCPTRARHSGGCPPPHPRSPGLPHTGTERGCEMQDEGSAHRGDLAATEPDLERPPVRLLETWLNYI